MQGKRVLHFVCLGNICRSPMAEAIAGHLLNQNRMEQEWAVRSSGTANYHIGEPPDARTLKTLREKNIHFKHLGTQFEASDFNEDALIFAMDLSHYHHLKNMTKEQGNLKKVYLFGDLISFGKGVEIPDPWYGDQEDFREVYKLLLQGCEKLIEKLKDNELPPNFSY